MEKSIKGTRTEQNLLKSFAGESQARGRYTIFAEVAKKEGYEQIAAIFMETAEQEFAHAKNFFSYLDEGMLEITASYPAGPIGDTARNLKEAAMGEHEEWSEMYVEFARVAQDARYLKLLERVQTGTVFASSEDDTQWICRYCGYVHTGKEAPKRCPVCKKEQAYFERKPENY